MLLVTTLLAIGCLAPPASARGDPQIFTATCPGPECPNTTPTSAEQGFAADVLARINIERAQPQRRYTVAGKLTPLTPLPMNPALEQTAQAFAEYLASSGSLEDYSGQFPDGEYVSGENAGGPGANSAEIDNAAMISPGHAGAVLSAADDFAGIGVGCDSSGAAWVVELFADANQTTANAGEARLQAELAANSVYAQSGGTITTVQEPPQDGGGTIPAQDAFPEQPIAADAQFSTGVDWTCAGATYAPGSAPTSPLPAPVSGIAASPSGDGYSLVDAEGAVSIHGDAQFHGAANGLTLSEPIDHIVPTPDGGGYWLVAGDGGVFCYGDARFYGSMGGRPLDAPVVDLAPAPDGDGYWLVASDGGVFAFGDAEYFGSMGGRPLNAPVVGIAPDGAHGGYQLVASDGGVFTFGAPYFGSTGADHLNDPIIGITETSDGGGYWLVASDGGIFAFGDASFHGSTGAMTLVRPIVGMATDPATGGYWLVASDGGVFAFGAPFYGAD